MMNLYPKTYSYVSKKSNNLILIAVGYIALLLTWFFGSSDKVFYFSYLTSYFYWLSIILGGMFFIMVHYAFSATWSVSIRRIMENTKKIKLFIGLSYLIIICLFLYFFFSKFSLSEITSYDFLRDNQSYFFELKKSMFINIFF